MSPFREEAQILLAASRWGAADADEVRATVARADGDPDGWLREWTGAGGAAWAAANERPDAALYLRAAGYYGAALAVIGATDGSVSERALAERRQVCWARAAALLGAQRIDVPYDGATLAASFFPAAAERRPVVVIDPGGRPASDAWAGGGAAARIRGFHWLTFESVLRPDWEAVLTPVADAMAARPDVDAARMAVIGMEHAGYGVARTLAFEHRFAAAALDPGVLDASQPWLRALPARAREAARAEDRNAFERELHLAGLFAPEKLALLRRLGGPFGGSLYDAHRRIADFRLGDELAAVRTPLLITEYADEPRWPGQARRLHELLSGPSELRTRTRGDETVADWLDRTLNHESDGGRR